MKKFIAIVLLITFFFTSYSQELKNKLQGSWVCTKILDQGGSPTTGKFGESGEYLEFTFNKDNMSITEAPFDKGMQIPIVYGADFIDLFPRFPFDPPEKIYTVKSLEGSDLIMSTKNENGETIDYHFINQEKLLSQLSNEAQTIDIGLIIIEHFNSSKGGGNKTFEYKISNEELFCTPLFNDKESPSFGGYISMNFVFPKTHIPETQTEELVVDFDVDENGAGNIRIVQSVSNDIDAALIKTIKQKSKKWLPLKVNGQPIKTTLRFHFVFFSGNSELELPIRRYRK